MVSSFYGVIFRCTDVLYPKRILFSAQHTPQRDTSLDPDQAARDRVSPEAGREKRACEGQLYTGFSAVQVERIKVSDRSC
jgi:hypothetical protein